MKAGDSLTADSSESDAMNLSAGLKLGPYEIESLIGSGGMGEVYQARDTRLGRKVALKVLVPGITLDADRLARFAEEARMTGLLNHPNILGVYDVGLHDGLPYVVSELLHGHTLRERMMGGPLPVRVAVGHALEIAHGLVAAHDTGIVHRDLKPENIFVTDDERLKILDFGLAKCRKETLGLPHQDSSKSTQPGTILGTVGYMSPEQVRGTATDARSDIFSFGVILHEMISGVAPFHGDSAIETLHAILKDDAPALPPFKDRPQLEQVVRHCLEKNPTARFQSARDLTFVLEFTAEFVLRDAPRPQPPFAKAWDGLRMSIPALF
jgi:eukaryotic-like serine/threonine-protein kinase